MSVANVLAVEIGQILARKLMFANISASIKPCSVKVMLNFNTVI